MTKTVIIAAAVLWASGAWAQGSGAPSGSGSGSDATATESTSPAKRKIPEDLREALQKLHAGNLAEVKLGQTAEQQAQSPEVRTFGQRMVQDHQDLDQKLQTVAGQNGVSLEGKAFQKEQKKLNDDAKDITEKSGAKFDKAYISQMVKDHRRDVKDVRSAAQKALKAKLPELAQFLTTTDGVMQQHLDLARQTQRTVESHQASRRSTPSGG
jgi:putative membrane protein